MPFHGNHGDISPHSIHIASTSGGVASSQLECVSYMYAACDHMRTCDQMRTCNNLIHVLHLKDLLCCNTEMNLNLLSAITILTSFIFADIVL